ncbi:peptide-methionine (S)-S-oxide reductase [Algoriphagus locisalis]|uniref:peptide-methionine (S)-S-oxide reductase n=1 Tax=Algoriphagus locisalis TaxID=305507 RepID=A0A1I6YDU0_9BACT|nr:peptide-methionine (S)-S-oxide reductase [Algoriphagus locisalis]SFT48511.1 peptide-methionine (S)-S-oxide reductase [Algoriphagus locisalis]
MTEQKIGFGGGCHWCTEAVFQSIIGVSKVAQGWIASEDKNMSFSQAGIVSFNPENISLKALIEIHLLTHASAANHSFRKKYRSAIYYVDQEQKSAVEVAFSEAKFVLDENSITKILPLCEFRLNEEEFLNYYQKRPNAPFCQTYISPKLEMLRQRYTKQLN